MSGQGRPLTWPQRIVRLVIGLVVAAVVIFVLFTEVFPRVEQYFEDPTFEVGGIPLPADDEVGT